MNTELILSTNIQNIATVYGGVRGTTLSSRHNICHWQTVVDSGIQTIIELREDDHSDRLCRLCEQYGIRYFAFPMDSHSVPNEVIASRMQEFFELIDNGDFYIACAMGLHRTDMALSIYWMFHGVDNGPAPNAAASGSSIRQAFAAPAEVMRSRIVLFSRLVTIDGTHATTFGLKTIVLQIFERNERRICLVAVKSETMP